MDQDRIWTQTGVYEKLPTDGSRAGYRFTEYVFPEGVPLSDAQFVSKGARAVMVLWRFPLVFNGSTSDLGSYRLKFSEDPHIQASYANSTSLATIREDFLTFARKVLSDDEQKLSAYADGFLQNAAASTRDKVTDHWVYLDPNHRIEELLAEMAATGEPERRGGGAGTAVLVWPEWWFELQVPVKVGEKTNANEGVRIRVDAAGSVSWSHGGAIRLEEDDLEERRSRTFADLRLGNVVEEGPYSSSWALVDCARAP